MDAEYASAVVSLGAALLFDGLVLVGIALYIRHRRRA